MTGHDLRAGDAPLQLDLLQAILDVADNLIVVLDPDGRIVVFNRACERTSGYRADEVRNRVFWELLVPEDEVDRLAAAFHELREHGVPDRHENHWRSKDGEKRLLSWSNTTVAGPDGRVAFIVGTGIDITDDAGVRTSLEETESRFRALVETMTDGLAADDPDGNLTFVNEALCRMLGRTSDELLGRPLTDHLTDESRGVLLEQSAQRRAGGDNDPYRLTCVAADGDRVEVLVSPQRLTDAGGAVAGTFAVLTDVTEIERFRESQALLATAIEQASESVVITDPDGTIRYVNPAFERLTGYAAEEAVGANPRILKSGRHDDAFYEHLWQTISSGRVWSGCLVNLRRDGSLFQEEATISPVLDDAGSITAYVAVKRDVTAEREITEQLNRSHKLEALSRLAGGIAHDLNNLLMTVSGAVDVLELQLPDSLAAAPELVTLREEVSRGADLSRRLLAVAQQQTLEMAPFDAGRFLQVESERMRRMVPESIRIELVKTDRPLVIRGDRGQLGQAILNLVVNAREAMPDGGVITLSATDVTADALLLAAHAEAKEGRYVRLRVADTGVGMDAETRERIFDPFFSIKNRGESLGLSLASVYGIVRQHAGIVDIDSSPGAGTTFDLYLPLADVAPEAEQPPQPPSPAGGGESVLVVEDETRVRETQVRMLEALGYTVVQAENGRVAIDMMSDPDLEIDAVLSDVTMPEVGGRELFERVRELRPDLGFVFTSGYAGPGFLDQLKHSSGTFFLPKPHSIADLASAIRKALAHSAPQRS